MELFKTKNSKCSYILFPNFNGYETPLGIFEDLKTPNFNKFGCPSITSVKNKIYSANSFLTIEIEFGLKNDEPYFNYVFDTKTTQITNDIHTFINSIISIQYQNNIINFQLLTPYAFVTDDKELEFTTVMPNMKTENCLFVNGGFRPYYWIRNFNSTWTLKDPNKKGKLYFNVNDPIVSVIFNKSVDLKYIEPTEKILNYTKQSFRSQIIRKNLHQVYNNVINRRPKKLL